MPHRVPDIGARQLAAVLAVAENRSFVAAAAQLQMSQPALTRVVRRVEDVLGVKLFERSTRSVAITAAGQEFLATAQRVTDELQFAAENMRDIASQKRGHVVVSCIMSVANGILPKAVSDYRKAHPGIAVRLKDGIHGSIMDDVKTGVADFGLSYLFDTPQNIVSETLATGTLELFTTKAATLPLQADGTVRFDDLQTLALVSLPAGSETRRVLDATAAIRGIRLNHAVTVSHIPTLLSFLRESDSAAVVPSTSVSGLSYPDLRRYPIKAPTIPISIGVVRSAERDLSPAAAGLLQAVQEHWPTD